MRSTTIGSKTKITCSSLALPKGSRSRKASRRRCSRIETDFSRSVEEEEGRTLRVTNPIDGLFWSAWTFSSLPLAAIAEEASEATSSSEGDVTYYAVALAPVALYGIFYALRSTIYPKIKLGDYVFFLASLVVVGNIMSIVLFKVRKKRKRKCAICLLEHELLTCMMMVVDPILLNLRHVRLDIRDGASELVALVKDRFLKIETIAYVSNVERRMRAMHSGAFLLEPACLAMLSFFDLEERLVSKGFTLERDILRDTKYYSLNVDSWRLYSNRKR